MVTFVITSMCDIGGCSFDLVGVKAGAILTSGTETWTVALAPGTYNFHCDVMPQLMNGVFLVTS
jgi:heme/copper-type cytochrome/quinol oxidase subunit 2